MARIGLITGLVLAVGMMPVTLGLGLLAKAGAEGFTDVPDDLELPPVPEASTLYASDGETIIATFGDQYRINTPSDEIAQVMEDAVIATEDADFHSHSGVDSQAMLRALIANFASGDVTEGASTITMQYVRQVLAYTATTPEEVEEATEISTERKIREMRYAMAIEQEMTKDEILTNYLNTVYFGNGAYGIGAAAQAYFGTTPAELTLNEAAMLTGIIQSPSSFDPINGDAEAAQQRRDHVLNRMLAEDYIDADTAAEVASEDLPLDPEPLPTGLSGPESSEWGFFADYFEDWWSQQEAFGATEEERLGRLNRGGYEIVSTLDPDVQATAEQAIAAQQANDSPYALGATVVEPGTGAVQAMAVNRDYSPDDSDNGPSTTGEGVGNYPNTTNPLLSGGDGFTGYQAGSTFKLFTLLAALEAGMPLDTTIYSPQQYQSQYFGGQGSSACGEYWCPSNADPSLTGDHTMWSAFGRSVNTYFVQLEERVGADEAVAMAERLGLTWHTDTDIAQADNAEGWGSFTLGVSSTTPLELAAAYATLPADGMYCEPTPVASVTDGADRQIEFADGCSQVLDVEVARAAVDAARCPTGYGAATGSCGGSGTAGFMAGQVGGPVAGKTGTTDSNAANWFAGFTPNAAVASFVADPDNPNNPVGAERTGLPAQVSASVLAQSWQSDPAGEFTPPMSLVTLGN